MNVIFKDAALKDIYEQGTTKESRYKKFCRMRKLVEGYQRVVTILLSETTTTMLHHYSFLHYEKLKYQGNETHSSVRIANGHIERLIFTEDEQGITIELIEIDNTHYGNR